MSELEVRVWRRYGNFRLYVSCADEKVGWCDPRTGEHEIGLPQRTDEFWTVIRAECERLRAAGTLQEDALEKVLGPAPVERVQAPPPQDDLSHNRPGSAASAHAAELKSRRPWLTTLAAIVGIRTEARDFAFGAKGERVVGRKLERWAAKRGWHVLHAVPVGRKGADIDHVLIGPYGVITVNTKTTRGKVWVAEQGMVVSGTKVDYLRNSRYEAQRTRGLLARAYGRHVPVQSVIVFVGATGFTVRGEGPRDVAVLRDLRAFRRWLRRRGTVLTPEQVSKVYELACQPSTWQTQRR